MLGQKPADLADSYVCTGSEVVRVAGLTERQGIGGSYGEDAVIDIR